MEIPTLVKEYLQKIKKHMTYLAAAIYPFHGPN